MFLQEERCGERSRAKGPPKKGDRAEAGGRKEGIWGGNRRKAIGTNIVKKQAIYLSSSSQPTKHSHRKVPKSCIPPSSGFQIETPRPGEKGLTVDHANIQVF